MKEQLELLFENWIDVKKRDNDLLNELFSKVFNRPLDKCPKCKSKAINELRKFYELTFNSKKEENGRKYILKPGNHYFITGDTAHNNENTNDQTLEWYLKTYPHIRPLFIKAP